MRDDTLKDKILDRLGIDVSDLPDWPEIAAALGITIVGGLLHGLIRVKLGLTDEDNDWT